MMVEAVGKGGHKALTVKDLISALAEYDPELRIGCDRDEICWIVDMVHYKTEEPLFLDINFIERDEEM